MYILYIHKKVNIYTYTHIRMHLHTYIPLNGCFITQMYTHTHINIPLNRCLLTLSLAVSLSFSLLTTTIGRVGPIYMYGYSHIFINVFIDVYIHKKVCMYLYIRY
jgi:hypothetical protein